MVADNEAAELKATGAVLFGVGVGVTGGGVPPGELLPGSGRGALSPPPLPPQLTNTMASKVANKVASKVRVMAAWVFGNEFMR